MALCSVIADNSRLFSVSAGSSAGLLFGSLTRCTIRVLGGGQKLLPNIIFKIFCHL